MGGGLGALGGWGPGREGGMEGSPGNVFGTTSGRGIEAIRASQWERVTMASYRTLGLGVGRVCRVYEVRVDRRYSLQNVLRLDKLQVQAIGKDHQRKIGLVCSVCTPLGDRNKLLPLLRTDRQLHCIHIRYRRHFNIFLLRQ